MGRMDKKKADKGKSKGLSPLLKLGLKVVIFFTLFLLMLGFTYLPGVDRKLDFSARIRSAKILKYAFPKYEVHTVNASPRLEENNILTVGFLKKTEIAAISQQNGNQQNFMSFTLNQARFRIRELYLIPHLVLFLLCLLSPIPWPKRFFSWVFGAAFIYGLLALKLIGMFRYEITGTYTGIAPTGGLGIIPYLSSPGLVFLLVIIIWMISLVVVLNRKDLIELLPEF